MTTIAFLGLGHMGGPMAANLRRRRAHGARLRPGAAAEGGRCRQGRAGLRQRRAGGLGGRRGDHVTSQRRHREGRSTPRRCPLLPKGTLFIDTSTISVDDARAIHAQAVERGHAQLDAPVSGGVKGATAGTLAFMVGGEDDAVERARPVLEPLAGKIIHCGASGTGQAAKLCNNMVLAVQQIAVGEAFVLAEKLGLSAQSLFDVITGATGNCWAVHTNCPVPGPVPTSPANNDFKPGFATALMNKDIGLAMDAVSSTGSSAPLGSHAAEIYAQVRRRPRRQGLQRGHRNDPQGLERCSRFVARAFGLDPSGVFGSAGASSSGHHHAAVDRCWHRDRRRRQVGGRGVPRLEEQPAAGFGDVFPAAGRGPNDRAIRQLDVMPSAERLHQMVSSTQTLEIRRRGSGRSDRGWCGRCRNDRPVRRSRARGSTDLASARTRPTLPTVDSAVPARRWAW